MINIINRSLDIELDVKKNYSNKSNISKENIKVGIYNFLITCKCLMVLIFVLKI